MFGNFIALLDRIIRSDVNDNCSRLIRFLNKNLNIRPSSYPFVSGDSFRALSDIIYEGNSNRLNYKPVKAGDVIFCETHRLKCFIKDILPKIGQPFILITHNSDTHIEIFPEELFKNKFLSHWYAQNCFIRHHKITNIPIGLENAWMRMNGIVYDFKKLRKLKHKKKPRILWGFNVKTNLSERIIAADFLEKSDFAVRFWMPPKKYRSTLNDYMFVASPSGNGIDCHRTWEALYLSVIPVVIKSNFWTGFEKFPGMILESWSDLESINEKKLIKVYEKKLIDVDRAKYLWMDYWCIEIEKSVNQAKNESLGLILKDHK